MDIWTHFLTPQWSVSKDLNEKTRKMTKKICMFCSVSGIFFYRCSNTVQTQVRHLTFTLKSSFTTNQLSSLPPFNLLIWKTRGRICENPSSPVVSSRVFPNRCALSFGPVLKSCTTFSFSVLPSEWEVKVGSFKLHLHQLRSGLNVKQKRWQNVVKRRRSSGVSRANGVLFLSTANVSEANDFYLTFVVSHEDTLDVNLFQSHEKERDITLYSVEVCFESQLFKISISNTISWVKMTGIHFILRQ